MDQYWGKLGSLQDTIRAKYGEHHQILEDAAEDRKEPGVEEAPPDGAPGRRVSQDSQDLGVEDDLPRTGEILEGGAPPSTISLEGPSNTGPPQGGIGETGGITTEQWDAWEAATTSPEEADEGKAAAEAGGLTMSLTSLTGTGQSGLTEKQWDAWESASAGGGAEEEAEGGLVEELRGFYEAVRPPRDPPILHPTPYRVTSLIRNSTPPPGPP